MPELQPLVDRLRAAFGDDLVGVYAHGSAATGGYRAGVSDVDVLVVMRRPVPAAEVAAEAGNGLPGPLELTVVTPAGAAEQVVPVTEVLARGIVLHGPPAAEVLAAPPWNDYLAAIVPTLDVALDRGLSDDPGRAVLVVCRALLTLLSPPGTVLGKEEAAALALERLPAEHRPLIARALAARVDPAAPQDWDQAALRRFRSFVVGAAVRRRPGRKVAGLP